MRISLVSLASALVALGILAACNNAGETPFAERAPEDLFDEGEELLAQEAYPEAAEIFNEVERQHPHSELAPRALLLSGYALYSDQNYAEALATFQRFIDLHPGNIQIDYAYYLRAVCYYEQISDIERDQEMTRLGVNALEELLERYPESQYARDAQLKLDLAYDLMAGKHVAIGRYYQRQGDWLAAINRFNRVISEFDTTTHIEEALHRLVESYLALGLVGEARRTAAVLGHNYPNSEWYSLSYALVNGEELPDDSSFLERSFRGLF
ncbi:MAG: outer membrane protein assembly factor BamD [Alphaproteobacteria bacterium]|nr:outer membrane protein assembly factor BamD [Alphaproteobacteria bacterium]